jgi:hypothetical protein
LYDRPRREAAASATRDRGRVLQPAPRIGGDHLRGVRCEGNLVILTPPPRQSGDKEEYRELAWQRTAAE